MTAAHAIAGLLLLANAGLIGLVLSAGGGLSAQTSEPLVTLKERINQDRLYRTQLTAQHAPQKPGPQTIPQPPPQQPPPQQVRPHASASIVLAGMEGFQGDPCPALAGFLDLMDSGIREAGGQLPPVDRGLMLSGSCSIDDPLVNLSLRKYRGAWVAAGLPPLTPFRHLGKK
ncbi:MAG: hypothetical protein ACI8RZ_007202 [Myxococcota bacterium]|jgi:hypothetical protein